jgi:2-polyprenyl-6-methoxyphenol hydroxylase-like FAD-dependent oxidoreductase
MEKGRVLIAGGGIGGLVAALALIQRGFEVHVYEQAPELREFGAGVAITPNGSRVLNELGLQPELEQVSSRPKSWAMRLFNTGDERVPLRLREQGFTAWVGPSGQIVTYPLRQGKLMNVAATVRRNDWLIESWSEAGTVRSVEAILPTGMRTYWRSSTLSTPPTSGRS